MLKKFSTFHDLRARVLRIRDDIGDHEQDREREIESEQRKLRVCNEYIFNYELRNVLNDSRNPR